MSPATKTAGVIIVEPGDRRLAMCGIWPDKAAWYEQADDDDPVYIVVTRVATDDRLASLGKRFGVATEKLIAFRASIPA